MRLTLRTMLAYLDRTLDASDAEQLSEKIKESEFATGLVHRIRSATRHLRLGAPKLGGKGVGQDPNSVAEYLDSTLPQDRVPDFEKVCLESDVQLAEVASCHQILARVLGEPAHVESDMRERMYKIEATGRRVKDEPAAPPVTEDRDEERAILASHVEDVSKSKVKPWAIVVALLLLIGVLFVALGPFDENHLLLGSFFAQQPTIASNGDPADIDPAKSPAQGDGETGGAVKQGVGPDPATSNPASPDPGDTGPAVPGATAPAGDGTSSEPATPGGTSPPPATGPPATSPPATSPPATATTDPDLGPSDDVPRAAPPVDVVPAVPAVREVGRFISTEQVLLRFEPEKDAWLRLQAPSVMRSGDRLAVPPTFRPPVVLTNSIQMIFAGASAVEIGVPDENEAPNVSLRYGRVVLLTAGKAGAEAHLVLDGRAGTVTFGDATSAMAVEVSRHLPPGEDPEKTSAQRVIQVFATGAQITWSEKDREVIVEPGNVLTMVDANPPVLFSTGEAPGWIDLQPLPDNDRLASRGLEPFLKRDRPISLSMQEQVSFRKVEVAALAIRSLSHLGYYEPLIGSLRNEWQHSYWPMHFTELRAAIARSPAEAIKVRVGFEKLVSEDAELLYRLLWMYSPKQLADGEAGHLVELLENDSMAVRVLAYENLRRITGRNFFYKPEREPDRQKDRIRRWRELLDQGQIIYVTEPAPLPTRGKPAAG